MSTSGVTGDRGAQQPRPSEDSALGPLLDRHRAGLELCCYLMLGDRAKARTAMDETALTAREARVGVTPAIPGGMWLYRIAIHVCDQVEPGER